MLIEPAELERKAAELRAKLKEWELGYLVGLVEGEGGLAVDFNKGAIRRYYPRVEIGNINFNVLYYFKDRLNIGRIRRRNIKENWREFYIWAMKGREALILLRIIFDYLFSCKKIKAALLLSLNKENKGGYAELIYKQIKKLNNYEEDLNLQPKKINSFSFEGLTHFQLGLMAGLSDSEGTIHITKRGDPYFAIANTCPRLILSILKILRGCGLTVYQPQRQRKYYVARVQNKNVEPLLEKIKYYLIIKQKQADLAIEAARIIGQRGRHVSPEVRKRKKELYWNIRVLNTRGRAYSGGPSILAPASPSPPSLLVWGLPRPLILMDI